MAGGVERDSPVQAGTMPDMGKSPQPDAPQLAAQQEKLKAAHAKLVKEFEKLHRAKFSAASHKEYLEKLKEHLLALEAHTAAIHAQLEALHARRETLHEHDIETLPSLPSSHKPRNPRSR
jgi:hypothetical protein